MTLLILSLFDGRQTMCTYAPIGTGEAPFCAPAFSYVVRTKKGPFFVILVRGL